MRTEAEIEESLAKARADLGECEYEWTEYGERILERIETLEWVLENS